MTGETHCPLCASKAISDYFRDRRRRYLLCTICSLVFVPPEDYLTREAEKAEYLLHQNGVDDCGYRTFLSRLMNPLIDRLPPGASGLDFGCGPGPALSHMLREAGFEVALFDSFFAPERDFLDKRYDFITATEVVEHLYRPGEELSRLWSLLHQDGWLAIMTKLVRDRSAFANWHYKNDPTHVCFFSRATWGWWAQQHNAALEFVAADVILLQRSR
jgi:hypothetical protein